MMPIQRRRQALLYPVFIVNYFLICVRKSKPCLHLGKQETKPESQDKLCSYTQKPQQELVNRQGWKMFYPTLKRILSKTWLWRCPPINTVTWIILRESYWGRYCSTCKHRVTGWNPESLPLMLGSGFLTEAIGELPVTAVGPARPAGLGDPEVVRPGESCKTEVKPRWWEKNQNMYRHLGQNSACEGRSGDLLLLLLLA